MLWNVVSGGRRWPGWTVLSVLLVIGLAMLPQVSSADKADPPPSPLFQHSLEQSVDKMNVVVGAKVEPPANVKLAMMPHPDQIDDGSGSSEASLASPDQTVEDCMQTSANVVISPNPGDPFCDLNGIPLFLEGPTVVVREEGPYQTGVDIPIEMVQMNLTGSDPQLGIIEMQLSPFQPTPGVITNVVVGTGGELISGDVFFDVFVIIHLVDQGQQIQNLNPIQVGSPVDQLPPQPGTSFLLVPNHPPIELFPVGVPISPPVAFMCFVEHIIGDPCKVCVYQLSCVKGTPHPDSTNHQGICVGDMRIGSECPNNTCATQIRTKTASLCMIWDLVACEPSSLPPVPGPFGYCECEPAPTMPSTPTCPGEVSCPATPSCQEYISCGSASCPSYASCGGAVTCPGTPSCPDYPSCQSYPSCPAYATCHFSSTCHGQPTCNTTPTCVNAISCDQLDSYPVVFSTRRDSLWSAEGLLVPGHPEPNDVYALGPASGFHAFGELFQSSGAVLGAPPDMTNIDRISAALDLGPVPGPPPYHGPFAPNTAALAAVPSGGPGRLGLVGGDNINAFSYGTDGGQILLFSVDFRAVGRPSTAVHFQSTLSPAAGPIGPSPPSNGGGDPGDEAAGDLFRSAIFRPFGAGIGPILKPAPFMSNALELDEVMLGLQAPAASHDLSSFFGEDDLDALEAEDAIKVDFDVNGDLDTVVFFSLDRTSTQAVAPTPDPFPGAGTGPDPDGVTADDILASYGGASYYIFARGVLDIGLLAGDDIDALALSNVNNPDKLDAGDEILFSLRLISPSLVAGANPNMPPGILRPGDVYRWDVTTGAITNYAKARTLGLLGNDDLDALDIGVCDCTYDDDGDLIPDICEPSFISPGRDIGVAISPCFTLSYARVLTPGFASVAVLGAGPAPPAGRKILPATALRCLIAPFPKADPSADEAYYEINDDALAAGDSLEICLEYDPSQISGGPLDLQMNVADGNGGWIDVTTDVDTTENLICGFYEAPPNKSPEALALTVTLTLPDLCSCDCHADPACDGVTNVLDVVNAVNVAFKGGAPIIDPNPSCPFQTTDVDCNAVTNVIDVVKLVNVAFKGGNAAVQFCNPCP